MSVGFNTTLLVSRIIALIAVSFFCPGILQSQAEPSPSQPTLSTKEQERLARVFGTTPPLTTAKPDATLPKGSIKVQVVDEQNQAIAGARVELAEMRGEQRQHNYKTTDKQGIATFTPTQPADANTKVSYRVYAPYKGARYGSTPFQLPKDQGYHVHITRLPVTRNAGSVVQIEGSTQIHIGDHRLFVLEQRYIANVGDHTFVFSNQGPKDIDLPAGFADLNIQPGMHDVRATPTRKGVALAGSIPPGRVRLQWQYALDYRGSRASLEVHNPWQNHIQRVMLKAAASTQLDVAGMPPARWQNTDQGRYLITQIQRMPNQRSLSRVALHIHGIPTAGTWHWVSLGTALAVLLLCALAGWYWQRSAKNKQPGPSLADIKASVLDDAERLAKQYNEGTIGKDYYREQRALLIDALAIQLHAQAPTSTSSQS